MLAELCRRHSKLTVSVEATDRVVDLVEEGFDAAIRIRQSLPDSTLVARRIRSIAIHTVASPGYLKAHGTPQKPEDLSRHNCFIYTLSSRPFDWTFNAPGGQRTVKVRGAVHANHGQLLLEPLRTGLGIARLPEFLISGDLKSGKLVPILGKYPIDPLSLFVVYPPSRHSSPKIRALVDIAAEWFAPEQNWSEHVTAVVKSAPPARGKTRERVGAIHGV
jgi:DNA-binding transcriptional LysR family regulator